MQFAMRSKGNRRVGQEHDITNGCSMMGNPNRPRGDAKIFINKLEAARRQINAAIRMSFLDEDELAIHTVAAAAYSIVRDLLGGRGRSDVLELARGGIYQTARSLAAGELSESALDHDDLTRESPHLRDIIIAMAAEIRAKGDAFTPDMIRFIGWGDVVAADRKRLAEAANFLKHADRDARRSLALDKINNDEIIMRAGAAYIGAYRPLYGPVDNIVLYQTPEMSAFHIWWMARNDPDRLRQEYGVEFTDDFLCLDLSQRRHTCLRLIELFRQWRSDPNPASIQHLHGQMRHLIALERE